MTIGAGLQAQGEVAERLLDRLEDCRRTFPVAAILGGAGMEVASRLVNGRAGIQYLTHMDLSRHMLERAQREQKVNLFLSLPPPTCRWSPTFLNLHRIMLRHVGWGFSDSLYPPSLSLSSAAKASPCHVIAEIPTLICAS